MIYFFVSAICLLVAVSVFGGRWPVEFAHEFHSTHNSLEYSFILATLSCVMMFAAGSMILVHMIKTRDYLLSLKQDYLTAEELLGKDEEGNVKYI